MYNHSGLWKGLGSFKRKSLRGSLRAFPFSIFFLLPNHKCKEYRLLSFFFSKFNMQFFRIRAFGAVSFPILFQAGTLFFANFSGFFGEVSLVQNNRLLVWALQLGRNLCSFRFFQDQIMSKLTSASLPILPVLRLVLYNRSRFLLNNANVSSAFKILSKKKSTD